MLDFVEPHSISSSSLSLPAPSLSDQVLLLWINSTLKEEHIVVQSLEEDLYDGLVLHHLLSEFTHLKVSTSKLLPLESQREAWNWLLFLKEPTLFWLLCC